MTNAWNEANRDRTRENARQYRINNPERVKAAQHKYYVNVKKPRMELARQLLEIHERENPTTSVPKIVRPTAGPKTLKTPATTTIRFLNPKVTLTPIPSSEPQPPGKPGAIIQQKEGVFLDWNNL